MLLSRVADPGARPSLLRHSGAGLPAASAASPRLPRRARHHRHPRPSPRRRRRASARGRRRRGYPCRSRPVDPRPRPPCPVVRPRWAHIPNAPTSPIPSAGCAGRLRDLPACAICAEIADAGAEWFGWLAGVSESSGDGEKISDVLPLCRDHVWQARAVAGPALAQALAGVVLREAEQRLAFAADAADAAAAYSGSRRLIDRLGRAFGAAPARRPVLASLRRGRECPLCARIRDAGERALALLAALVEDADERRAFENGYGLCVRHGARAMADAGRSRPRRHRRANDACPPGIAALGTRRAAPARRMAGETTAARRRIGRLAQGRSPFRRHRLATSG